MSYDDLVKIVLGLAALCWIIGVSLAVHGYRQQKELTRKWLAVEESWRRQQAIKRYFAARDAELKRQAVAERDEL